MNKVILKGRLTAYPEIRYSQASEPVAMTQFSVAVSRGYKKENKDVVDFISCKAYRKTAEFIQKYFQKGQEILLEGKYYIDNYEKNGEKKKSHYVLVEIVDFCGSKASNMNNSNNQNNTSDADTNYQVEEDIDDDDLPF